MTEPNEPLAEGLQKLLARERDAGSEDDETLAMKQLVRHRLEQLAPHLSLAARPSAGEGEDLPGNAVQGVAKGTVASVAVAAFGAGALVAGTVMYVLNTNDSTSTPVAVMISDAGETAGQGLDVDVGPDAAAPDSGPAPIARVPDAGSADGGSRVRHPKRADSLARERETLDVAQAALGRGELDVAVRALETHTRLWPTGELIEEREALWVLTLTKAGRTDEARERGEKFHREFPASIHGAAIDKALQLSGRQE